MDTCDRQTPMSSECQGFAIPRAGLEVVPLAALAAIPLPPVSSRAGAARLLSESTLGALAVFAAYQALLTALRTEAVVRRGELDRPQQARLVVASVWAAMREGAAIGLACSLLLLVLPWLSLPLTALSLVGIGKASLQLTQAFWDGLSPAERGELHRAAFRAGVNLERLLRGTSAGLEA